MDTQWRLVPLLEDRDHDQGTVSSQGDFVIVGCITSGTGSLLYQDH